MINKLFPRSVVTHLETDFQQASTLTPEEFSLLSSNASPKRQQSFTLGRSAAKKALKKAGVLTEQSILRDEEGCPLWPTGYCGSISHSGEMAVAAVGSKENVQAIGVDIEHRNRRRDLAIQSKIASPDEQKWISHSDSDPQCNLLLLFSAKEAIYKAMYTLYKEKLTWKDAELRWIPARNEFLAQITFSGGLIEVPVHAVIYNRYIITGVALFTTD